MIGSLYDVQRVCRVMKVLHVMEKPIGIPLRQEMARAMISRVINIQRSNIRDLSLSMLEDSSDEQM
jgi:hypothetical protein